MKVKSYKKDSDDLQNFVCIGVDGISDKDTSLGREVKTEYGETKLKKIKRQEHHLIVTKEPGTDSGTYLTQRVIPITGATGCS